MSDPWYADKIPLGTGLQHRHGKLEVDFNHVKNVPKAGPAGPKGDTGATGPPGPTSTELPPYTIADAGKALVVMPDGTLAWRTVVFPPSVAYTTTLAYRSGTTYEGT